MLVIRKSTALHKLVKHTTRKVKNLVLHIKGGGVSNTSNVSKIESLEIYPNASFIDLGSNNELSIRPWLSNNIQACALSAIILTQVLLSGPIATFWIPAGIAAVICLTIFFQESIFRFQSKIPQYRRPAQIMSNTAYIVLTICRTFGFKRPPTFILWVLASFVVCGVFHPDLYTTFFGDVFRNLFPWHNYWFQMPH